MTEDKGMTDEQRGTAATQEPTVVGVRFRSCGKIYLFQVDDIDVSLGTYVVVDSEMGLSLGCVVTPKHTITKENEKLKKVIRIASSRDIEKAEKNRSLEEESKAFCVEKANELNLPMKIVATETTLDRKRLIFYFTADGRIDFRELVRDLAAKFKTRIEMRQIGVRDEVKLLGGIGACGRQSCCSSFLTSFAPITIRMAKQQELSINQNKLSGICGRLMCCLSYEYEDRKEAAMGESNKDFIIVTEEVAESNLEAVGSDVTSSEEPKQTVCAHCEIQEKKITSKPQTGEPVRKKHKRRDRRKKRKSGQSHEKNAEKSGKTGGEPDNADGRQAKRKEKGKPFSRRRKFWRKKKQ